MTAEPCRRAVLFANLRSRRGHKWLFATLDACRDAGIDVVATHFDLRVESIERALERARQLGVETVLVSGGDGTVGCVVGCLAHTDLILGVLPSGTSNDFARSLRIPLTATEAVQVVANGRTARVDLGSVNDLSFCHAAVVGINTAFAREAERLRNRLRRLAYPVAAVFAYLHRHTFEVQVSAHGMVRQHDAFAVAVVNAPKYGGPLELEVDAAGLESHRLRLVVVERLDLITVLRAVAVVLARRRGPLPGTVEYSVREARLETRVPMPVTLDGQVKSQTPADISVQAAALRVFVPADFAENTRESRLRSG